MKNCSFTGHRIIAQEHIKPLEELLTKAILYAYDQGCRNFYCGGALGFDTMAAKKIISLRMKYRDMRLYLVLPCKEQSYNWTVSERSMYDYILSSADEVIYTSERYTKDCMRIRNMKLAEICDILIAFCGRQRSGSYQTVRMASELEKAVFNLYSRVVNRN